MTKPQRRTMDVAPAPTQRPRMSAIRVMHRHVMLPASLCRYSIGQTALPKSRKKNFELPWTSVNCVIARLHPQGPSYRIFAEKDFKAHLMAGPDIFSKGRVSCSCTPHRAIDS